MNEVIDLRSDTVTQPTSAMLQAMCSASVGDDVMGEDPTVNELEQFSALLTGKEAALFLPTATQSNLASIMSHCQRGDEYIVGSEAHCYKWEGGGAAVLGSVQPQPICVEANASLDLDRVKQSIKPDDPHFAKTRLLCLENTHMGKPLSLDYLKEAYTFTKAHHLKLHIDGARGFNAAVASNVSIKEIAKHCDSMTLCLSKGLGCPAGALLCSTAELIHQARRWRKVLGGGMRQAGILAASGLFALKNHVERLEEDHQNAELLANELRKINHPAIKEILQQTNMVFVKTDPKVQLSLQKYLAQEKIKILTGYTEQLRLVLHMGISKKDTIKAASALQNAFCSGEL